MSQEDIKNLDIVIVGAGIAGSVLAYELEKIGVKYEVFTDQKIPLRSTSSLSYGHFRIAKSNNIEDIIKTSVNGMGQDEQKMRFVYNNSHLVQNLLDELEVIYENRSFGVIPSGKIRGGLELIKLLHGKINNINSGFELIDFETQENKILSQFISDGKLFKYRSKYLVLATGGYGGSFEHTNNIRYNNYNVFDIVEKNGGTVINTDCLFRHPFGYNKGTLVLIGKDVSKGDFIDENENFVFDEEIRTLLKNDAYHSHFHDLLNIIEEKVQKGNKVYFVNENDKIEITPTVHYTSGGIKTNHLGSVEGIANVFAIGECQANGNKNHGRLPGYPFTSAVVYGKKLSKIF